MTELELKEYLLKNYPIENESCEWKEFKSLKHSFSGQKGDDMISYISALANMEGGHLVIGVKDKSLDISGIEDFHNHTTQNIILRILEKCSNLDSENLSISAHTTSDTNKTVWVINVPKHLPRQPVIAHAIAWQRIEDSLISMREERREAILSETLHSVEDWSANIIEGATINDLDEKAIAKAREEYKKKFNGKSGECDAWDDITFLNKVKVTIQSKITNTAIILLGKEESDHFIKPAIAKMSWILKDKDGIERDYEHFAPPFILNSEKLFNRVRNLTYRYINDNTLFPTEIKTYEPYVIREALHNCIAHQDYSLAGIIRVVEKPDELIFTNVGGFIPGSVEKVIEQDAPQEIYRNPFLAQAMVHLNMIDTIGSGIRRMFIEQRNRFFPLPEYNLTEHKKVSVTIAGRIWDENYTRLLINKTDLNLKTVVLLDKVQKGHVITEEEIKLLKSQNLIEGRKPNFHVSHIIADKSDQKADYIKNKAFDDAYYRDMIIEFLRKFKTGKRKNFEDLLIDKLPEVLSEKQKFDKVKNLLQSLKTKGVIELDENKKWRITRTKTS